MIQFVCDKPSASIEVFLSVVKLVVLRCSLEFKVATDTILLVALKKVFSHFEVKRTQIILKYISRDIYSWYI